MAWMYFVAMVAGFTSYLYKVVRRRSTPSLGAVSKVHSSNYSSNYCVVPTKCIL